jgi:hypothetical protein
MTISFPCALQRRGAERRSAISHIFVVIVGFIFLGEILRKTVVPEEPVGEEAEYDNQRATATTMTKQQQIPLGMQEEARTKARQGSWLKGLNFDGGLNSSGSFTAFRMTTKEQPQQQGRNNSRSLRG